MCGILGLVGSIDKGVFNKALDRISHRGPDGFGIWHNEPDNIILGHRRLAILDLSDNGSQPMHYGKFVIVFNGEIYNFLEIRNQLLSEGYIFKTDSDTEVILAAYIKWKELCLRKFNGMWALAIWDKEEKRLFLSRDRFGKKPLFYTFLKDKFVFASEMKALFPFLTEVKPSKEFSWCQNHVFDYESTDICLIEGIKRFPAAHYGYLNVNYIDLHKYWETSENLIEVPKSYMDQVSYFRDLFIDACKIRMRADVPIGTSLSGGLDSSAVVCAMHHIANSVNSPRVSKDWQHAFVAAFPDTFLDEREYADKVTNYLGIQASHIIINPPSFEELFNQTYLVEELNTTTPVPMIKTYQAMREKGIVVSMDGHGADELLSGYGGSIFNAFLDCGLNPKEIRNILQTYQDLRKPDNPQLPFTPWSWSQYFEFIKGNKKNIRDLWLVARAKKKLGIAIPKCSAANMGSLNFHLYELFHTSIFPTLLRNYDRYSMISGIEIRMPFVDYRLVNFCFSIPWSSKLRNGYIKSIVRDALKDIMPTEIVNRKNKLGFNTPLIEWMRSGWKEPLLDIIHSKDFKESSLIDSVQVKNLVEKVIYDKEATFFDAYEAWNKLNPYIWEKSMIRNSHIVFSNPKVGVI